MRAPLEAGCCTAAINEPCYRRVPGALVPEAPAALHIVGDVSINAWYGYFVMRLLGQVSEPIVRASNSLPETKLFFVKGGR